MVAESFMTSEEAPRAIFLKPTYSDLIETVLTIQTRYYSRLSTCDQVEITKVV